MKKYLPIALALAALTAAGAAPVLAQSVNNQNMVPYSGYSGTNPDSPSFTGGGSTGYNAANSTDQ